MSCDYMQLSLLDDDLKRIVYLENLICEHKLLIKHCIKYRAIKTILTPVIYLSLLSIPLTLFYYFMNKHYVMFSLLLIFIVSTFDVYRFVEKDNSFLLDVFSVDNYSEQIRKSKLLIQKASKEADIRKRGEQPSINEILLSFSGEKIFL
ncbi:MAG: hypothetical protein GT601_05795 [Acidaminobacter sp.]|uniref:hypothetical protein n=1 Tax=Acidaminobacter sp. TaxID=1872102 RepID=UPI0013819AC8|nr:hypothetical protein [Acidaminobacter sp.]MZQ97168.1 hypothetical protein [Acidaminobacter sp.]